MKLKKWLSVEKQMTYAEYLALPEMERFRIQAEHQEFCRKANRHKQQGWRPMTEEEKKRTEEILAKEKERFEKSLMVGGADQNGYYTALHHRWDV